MSMIQVSSHMSYQLPNDLTRLRKLIHSVESLDPKLLATIFKVETDDNLKSDVVAMAA